MRALMWYGVWWWAMCRVLLIMLGFSEGSNEYKSRVYATSPIRRARRVFYASAISSPQSIDARSPSQRLFFHWQEYLHPMAWSVRFAWKNVLAWVVVKKRTHLSDHSTALETPGDLGKARVCSTSSTTMLWTTARTFPPYSQAFHGSSLPADRCCLAASEMYLHRSSQSRIGCAKDTRT